MGAKVGVIDFSEDEFFEIDVSSYSVLLTPPKLREFEFNLRNFSKQSNSPADALIHKGKLLPLEVRNHLNSEASNSEGVNALASPLTSCNISLPESCRVSTEYNRDDHFDSIGDPSGDGFANEKPKKLWSKKFKFVKRYFSRSKLKSWFSKSSADLRQVAAKVADERMASSKQGSVNEGSMSLRQSPVARWGGHNLSESDCLLLRRRSFVLAAKRMSACKTPLLSLKSSPVVNNSHGYRPVHIVKRCRSTNADMESPIDGAIAHCKRSQQLFLSGDDERESQHLSDTDVIIDATTGKVVTNC